MDRNLMTATLTGGANTRKSGYRRIALGLGALAIAGMAATTVACTPRHDGPGQSGPATGAPNVTPTEKAMRTNVTRTPQVAAPPQGVVLGNAAVPCGFGPRGGGPCANNG